MTDVIQILVDFLTPIRDEIWILAFAIVIGIGLYFTYKLKFMQITRVKQNATLAIFDREKKGKRKISSFEAFCISMGNRIGVGNISGVAIAIVTGGPGAVMWMWLFAIIGSASSFMETVLGQLYKEKKDDGGYYGGLAYYSSKGFKNRNLGILLAFLAILSFSIGFAGFEASNACSALANAFPSEHSTFIFALLITIGASIVIFGGVTRIGRVSSKVVPLMAVIWMIFCTIVICMNIQSIGNAINMIFVQAFKPESVIGGGLGTVILVGLRRGVSSNEGGLGSTPSISASADVSHPVKQGFIQSFGVLVDTLIVCSFTAFVILTYGNFSEILSIGESGSVLVQEIVASTAFGNSARYIIAVFLLVFAFTTVLGCYTVGETNLRFVTNRRLHIIMLRFVVLASIFLSSIAGWELSVLISDIFMAFLGCANIIVVLLMSPKVMVLYRDYLTQKKNGVENPVFNKSIFDNTDGITEWD